MPPTPATTAVAPLHLVTGPEALLRDRAVAAVVTGVRAAEPDAQVQDLSAVGLEPGRVSELAAPSLFGGTTVIVVRDIADAGEALAEELKSLAAAPVEDIVLVLVHGGGVKGKAMLDTARKAGASVVECKALKWESDKVAFVQAEFRAARRKVAPEAATALVDALGGNLRELASACSQLVSDTEGLVDREVVERYHAGRVEVTGFRVADAAIEGRYEEALRLLRHALATGTDPVLVSSALASGLRNMAKVSTASRSARPDDVARELGLASFVVRKAKGQLAGWGPAGVATAIVAVARADEQVKGGGTDPVYALEKVIATIVAARAAG